MPLRGSAVARRAGGSGTPRRHDRGRLVVALLAGSLLGPVSIGEARHVEVVYLANEGVLLRAGSTAVLIDALFGDGLDGYASVEPATRSRLEGAEPPFDGVALVLATHRHRDHFDPTAVARFLAANPRAQFLSTPEAAAELRAALAGGLGLDRVHEILPAPGVAEPREVGGVSLRVLRLHHGVGVETQNLGFLVELGGARVLHVGDTQALGEDLAPLRLGESAVDLALLPVWYFVDEDLAEAIRVHVRPRSSVVFHIPLSSAPAHYHGPASSFDELVALVRQRAPGAELLTRPGQRMTVVAAAAR